MNYYFITGTGKGIGKALAEILLHDAKSTVYGYSRSQSIKHPQYKHINCDLSDDATLKNWEFPDLPDAQKIVLVNNAGVISEILRMGKLQNDSFINDTKVNLTAPLVLMNAFLKKYQKATFPRIIINVSSGAARRPIDAWGAYCSAKSGLDMISEVIAEEQKFWPEKERIKIFSVAPGVVDTAMQTQIRATDEKEFSGKQRFVDLKNNNELYSPEKSADLLSQFIFHTDKFTEVKQDIRHIEN